MNPNVPDKAPIIATSISFNSLRDAFNKLYIRKV